MKITYIILIPLLFAFGNIQAQHFNIGLKGGLNYYNLGTSNNNSLDPKPGIHLGLLSHIHLADQLAFQPELMYSGQGAKYMSGSTETKINLQYINLPLLLQYMFDNGFRIQAGPQFGFLMGAKAKTGNNTTDISDNYKSIDFGLGAGVSYVHPPTGFGVDARYNAGLSNINANGVNNIKNKGFQLGVFYLINHKSL